LITLNQLPSVGPGQFLTDLIESGAVPVIRLTLEKAVPLTESCGKPALAR